MFYPQIKNVAGDNSHFQQKFKIGLSNIFLCSLPSDTNRRKSKIQREKSKQCKGNKSGVKREKKGTTRKIKFGKEQKVV